MLTFLAGGATEFRWTGAGELLAVIGRLTASPVVTRLTGARVICR